MSRLNDFLIGLWPSLIAWLKLGRSLILFMAYLIMVSALWFVFTDASLVMHYGPIAPLVAGDNLFFFSILFMAGYLSGAISEDLSSFHRFAFLMSLLRNKVNEFIIGKAVISLIVTASLTITAQIITYFMLLDRYGVQAMHPTELIIYILLTVIDYGLIVMLIDVMSEANPHRYT